MSHLSLEERIRIKEGLDRKESFRSIARDLKRSPSTILWEIKNRRSPVSRARSKSLPLCKFRGQCEEMLVCGRSYCSSTCTTCNFCMDYCKKYVPGECKRLNKHPYVCNGCGSRNSCRYDQMHYIPTFADNQYRELLRSCREGINQDPERLEAIDKLISPLLKRGRSLAHIYAHHSDDIGCSRSTIYRYLDGCVFTARNMDLPRRIKYKIRKKKKQEPLTRVERQAMLARNYVKFEDYMHSHPDVPVVEMDTVMGPVNSRKCLLTLYFRSCSLMIGFLLKEHTQNAVKEALNGLCTAVGIETYKTLFPVILTDRGSEFSNPLLIEADENGEVRSRVFYCDPQSAWQKGALEKNHEFIRYVIPKGSSFDKLEQSDITLLMNHINSTARVKLNNSTPYHLSRLLLNHRLHETLNLVEIPPDMVHLRPNLLAR